MNTPNLAGEGVTRTPAFSKAATLSSALPLPPETIAPACPINIFTHSSAGWGSQSSNK